MTAEAWSALAAWATVAIAIGAAWFAYQQVTEARKTREKVAQPDVVVYVDHNESDWQQIDLVIKNFGQTPAYNIRLTVPPLKRVPFTNQVTGEEVTEVFVPDTIAVLAPGQAWRTMWDDGQEMAHYEGPLPSKFVGSIAFDDKLIPDKESFVNPISLDTRMFWNSMRASTEKARSTEKALYKIADTLDGYKKEHGGMWLYVIPGDEERQYNANRAAHIKERSQRIRRQLPGEPAPAEDC